MTQLSFCQFRFVPSGWDFQQSNISNFWNSGLLLVSNPMFEKLLDKVAELAVLVKEDLPGGLVRLFFQINSGLYEIRVALFARWPAHLRYSTRLGFRISRQLLV